MDGHSTIRAAWITVIGGIVVAVITGIFGLSEVILNDGLVHNVADGPSELLVNRSMGNRDIKLVVPVKNDLDADVEFMGARNNENIKTGCYDVNPTIECLWRHQ